jgi:hypothetical protein
MNSQFVIPEPPFPKTVYRTPNPEWDVSESYEILIEVVPDAPDPQRCWVVRELHGYFEEATKTYHHQVETLHPNEPRHFLTFEEVMRAANQQVLLRATQGFRFLFTMNYDNPPWYSRFEVVLPAGEVRPLP